MNNFLIINFQYDFVNVCYGSHWLVIYFDVISIVRLREDINRKKRFLSGIARTPKPPPPDPNSGNLVPFFGRQNRRFGRMTETVLDDDNYGFNDNYDDNFGDFYDDYDKND